MDSQGIFNVLLHIFFLKILNNYLFIFGCTGSSLLSAGLLQLWQPAATFELGCVGFSLQWLLLLWSMGLAAPRHVGSSGAKDQRDQSSNLHFPCTARQILNHWATREALHIFFTAVISHMEGNILLQVELLGQRVCSLHILLTMAKWPSQPQSRRIVYFSTAS